MKILSANNFETERLGKPDCGTFWGSHGCDLAAGHEGQHICGHYDPDGPCCSDSHWLNEDGSQGNPHTMELFR